MTTSDLVSLWQSLILADAVGLLSVVLVPLFLVAILLVARDRSTDSL